MADTNDEYKYELQGSGLSTKEKKWAKKRFEDYQSHYPHLNKLSDLQLLEELVFFEVSQEQYKEKVKSLMAKVKSEDAGAVPRAIQDQINNNLDQIIKLKERLGLFEDKKSLDVWQHLKDLFSKFALWREQNQDCRKVTCPFCTKPFFLMMRTDKYQESEFPMFKGKVLCNHTLHTLYKEGKVTQEEYADILGTSPDYITWLEENHFEVKVKKNVVTEEPTEKPTEETQEE
jgi:hypothetical protein